MVIGVGAIGRQVATLLAAMGAKRLTVVDPDIVGEENLAVQGYRPEDIDKPKVEVIKAFLEPLNPEELRIYPVQKKYAQALRPIRDPGDELVVFCCIDNIGDRKNIWWYLKNGRYTGDMSMFVDGRMAAETIRVITWQKGQDSSVYTDTLFAEDETFQAPCTGRSTLYSSYTIAGLMVGEFVKWMRNQTGNIAQDQHFNLLANELDVTYPKPIAQVA